MCCSSRSPAARLAVFLAALVLVASGCGLLSSDEASLPGVYESDEFRVQHSDGSADDVGDDGVALDMTLTDDGRVIGGLLTLDNGDPAAGVPFTGTYDRSGDRVTFEFDDGALAQDYFDTGTPLSEVEWIFYDEDDGMLGADADAYVIFLDREGDAPDEE